MTIVSRHILSPVDHLPLKKEKLAQVDGLNGLSDIGGGREREKNDKAKEKGFSQPKQPPGRSPIAKVGF